jgi:hypothetical protein
MRAAVVEPDFQEGLPRPPAPLGGTHARVHERHLDICERRLARQQRKGLEHETDFAIADMRELELREFGHGFSVQPVAPAVGRIQATEQVHERGLAAARGPHDRDVLAAAHDQVDARSAWIVACPIR